MVGSLDGIGEREAEGQAGHDSAGVGIPCPCGIQNIFLRDRLKMAAEFFGTAIGAFASQRDDHRIAGAFKEELRCFFVRIRSCEGKRFLTVEMKNRMESEQAVQSVRADPEDPGARRENERGPGDGFQIVDDAGACRLFDFKTADIAQVEILSLQQPEPFSAESVFGAMIRKKSPFAILFHKTITASIGLRDRRNGSGGIFGSQGIPDKFSVNAGSHRRKQHCRHMEKTKYMEYIPGASAQRKRLAVNVNILTGGRQTRHPDNDIGGDRSDY